MSRNERYGWLGLLWQAVFLGLSSSILMALLTLLLAPQAQAAETARAWDSMTAGVSWRVTRRDWEPRCPSRSPGCWHVSR